VTVVPASPASGGGDIFAALGDPTRRTIIELLVAWGQSTPTQLASELGISRQAVSKHLGQLTETGLAVSKRQGRENLFAVDAEPLSEVTGWVAAVESQWAQRLEHLRASLTDEM
jgi:DNA-binding transcriptional ArsR family regulator